MTGKFSQSLTRVASFFTFHNGQMDLRVQKTQSFFSRAKPSGLFGFVGFGFYICGFFWTSTTRCCQMNIEWKDLLNGRIPVAKPTVSKHWKGKCNPNKVLYKSINQSQSINQSALVAELL